MLLQLFGHRNKYTGGKGHIEQPMLFFLAVTDLVKLLFQGFKGLVSAFMA